MRRTALVVTLAALVGALVAVPIAVYASHQFTDVPNTNPFHADIDWLANSGVTKGCGGSTYCPKNNVTREQMAAFMRRLSGNDPAVPPSVNAIQLGGFTAQELAPRAVHSATEDAPDGQPSYVLGTAVNVVAPTQGTITITGGVSGNIAGGGDNIAIGCRLTINDVEVPGSQRDVFLTPLGAPSGSCSTNAAKNVPKGTYEIELVINTSPGVSSLSQASVWAVWVPFNGLGNTPFVP